MNLKDHLEDEFARRCRRNGQYSLRAFARDLATNHASLSQILRGRRAVSSRMAHQLGRRAGLNAQEIARCCEAQNDRAVLRVIRSRSFRPGSRWIAVRSGIPIDAVNCSLVRLLQRGALVMESPRRWTKVR